LRRILLFLAEKAEERGQGPIETFEFVKYVDLIKAVNNRFKDLKRLNKKTLRNKTSQFVFGECDTKG